MNLKYLFFYIFNLIILINHLNSQIQQVHNQSKRIFHFDTENGLPQNTVDHLVFDEFGRLYIGTQGGLAVFDGRNLITNFNLNTTNRTFFLFKSLNGKIYWVPFNLNKIYEINTANLLLNNVCSYSECFKHFYDNPNNLLNDTIRTKYYFLINNFKNANIVKIDSTKSTYLFNEVKDYARKLYFKINNKLLSYDNNQIIENLNEGIKKYSINLPNDWIKNSLIFYESNETYILYQNNIYNLKLSKNNHIEVVKIAENIPLDKNKNNIVSAAYSTKMGVFAFGTSNSGFYIAEKNKYFSTSYLKGLDSDNNKNNIYSIALSAQNEILVQNNYLLSDNGNEKTLTPKSPYWRVFNFATSDKKLLTFNEGYICQIVNNKLVKLGNPIRKKGEYLISCFQYQDTILYLISEEKLYKFNTLNNTLKEIQIAGIPCLGDQFRYIQYYDKKNILLLTNTKIYTINLESNTVNKKISIFDADFRIASNVKGYPKQYWIGTYGNGYFLLKNDSLFELPLDKKGYLKYAHSFLEDTNGFIWISTNNGLFQINKEDILDNIKNKLDNLYFQYYDKSYGFGTNEFNGGCQSPALITKDKKFVYSSINGLVQFYPDKIKPLVPDGPIFIQNIKIDNVNVSPNDTIYINATSKNLEIIVNSPYFGHPMNQNLSYNLNQETRLDVPENGNIIFPNPGYGIHTLEVRKLSGFGLENYIKKKIIIIVAPHFYQTWWFYLIAIFLFIILTILLSLFFSSKSVAETKKLESIVKMRSKEIVESNLKLREANDKNHMLLSILLHDVKSPLKLIKDLTINTELMWNRLSEEDKILINRDIKSTSYKIYNKVQQYLSWININERILEQKQIINIRNLLSQIIETFKISENISFESLKFSLDCNEELEIYSNVHLIEIIIHNLIDNSIKNTSKGIISAYAYNENNSYIIGVKDTGVGMNWKDLEDLNIQNNKSNSIREDSYRMGYVFINDLVKKLNGEIFITSNPGKGTDVKIKLNKEN